MRFLPPAGARVARHVAERLALHGVRAWIVGGALRDLALEGVPADIDMASAAPPELLAEVFERTLAIGAAFGTVVVQHGGQDVQVTTFRSETGHSDQRRPDSVTWGHSVAEDAARRDFTCNALYLDPLTDELVDPEGGLADIEARRLRCVGQPARRFCEDGLRLIRLARFAAALDFEVEAATRAAAHAERAALAGVSPERVAGELRRMLSRPRSQRALGLFEELGLFDVCFPGFGPLAGERDLRWKVLGALEPGPGFEEGLAVMFETRTEWVGGEPQAEVAARAGLSSLRLSRSELRGVEELWRLCSDAVQLLGAGSASRAQRVRLLRAPLWPRAARLLAAWLSSRSASGAGLTELLSFGAGLAPDELEPSPLVSSDDLQALGLPRGPLWGRLLAESETLQLDCELTTRGQALEWLSRRARELAPG